MIISEVDPDLLAAEVSAEVDPALKAAWRPRWNAAPTDPLPVATQRGEGRVLSQLSWGFLNPEGGLTINARGETADRLAMFRRAFQAGRAVLPVDGFYEWQGPRNARVPLRFSRADGQRLFLAALADEGRFVILTTEAAGAVQAVHDRMPVIVPRDKLDAWLRGELAVRFPDWAAPRPEGIVAHEASTKVNDVKNDGPELLVPEKRAKQLTLL